MISRFQLTGIYDININLKFFCHEVCANLFVNIIFSKKEEKKKKETKKKDEDDIRNV